MPLTNDTQRSNANLFNIDTYIASLISDIEMIFEGLRTRSENESEQDYKELFSADYIYNFYYKRKYLYKDNLQKLKIQFPPRNKYFEAFKNHNKIFSDEWKPEGQPDTAGRMVVSKRNFERKILPAGTFLNQIQELSIIAKNQKIKIALPDREIKEDGAYVHFYGENIGDDLGENRNTLRFYFNFNPEPIFNKVTGSDDSFLIDFQTKFAEILFDNFNTKKIPFHLKIAQNRSKFYADNVVLYLERRYLNTMLNIFNENYYRFKHLLRTEVPMFTYKLYNGIGFAEGIELSYPEESFGRNKATFISELYDEITYKMQNEGFVLRDEIEKLLKEYRPDCKLFLNKNSKFEYVKFGDLDDKIPVIKNDIIVTNSLVDCVMKLGYEICKDAFWDDRGRCNWIGYSDEKSYKPLNLRYLDGISGVLLFLSEAYIISGDVLFKRFGQGTLESIFEKINQQQSKFLSQRGFHRGAGSLVYVVQKAIIAFELKDEYQNRFESELLTKVLESQDFKNSPYDIYGGTSGTLLGLLMVKKLLGNDFAKYDNKVLQIKDNLLEGNELWKTDDYFNRSIQKQHERMVGFPHGVSGIVYSLGLYQKFYNDNSQQISDKINEAFIFEENNRRSGNLWIDSIRIETENKRPPTTGWEKGLTAVGFSQIGLTHIGINGRGINNINKIIQYCTTKETILTSFRNVSSGVLDFFIECNSLTLNNGSFILEQIKPMIEELENNNLDLRNDANDSNFVHPGLIGLSGFGLSLIRLNNLAMAHLQGFQPVSSYILPS